MAEFYMPIAIVNACCLQLSVGMQACKTWEDFCWAYFRSCLDVSLDAALSRQCPPPQLAWRDADAPGRQLLGSHSAKEGSEPAALATAQ
eukprot:scaffold111688_cov28-Prasinocladus_malaysianus.AAC.1